jgi:tetratricopeptide (TPR) repeat protein
VVAALLESLGQITEGVVSITGFASAFTHRVPLEESLRILNFNRDRLVAQSLKQIWWITPSFLQTSIHAMPDINSWFSLRLQLTEMICIDPPQNDQPLSENQVLNSGSYTNSDDARRRAHNLLQRFEESKAAGIDDQELLTTYLIPALAAIADIGALHELQDLTMQFEGLLGQLKLVNSPDVAASLNEIAILYYRQGRYSEAEPLHVRSLEIRERQLGADHPDVATSLNNLAVLYDSQGRYSEAEPLRLRCLEIERKALGEEHPQFTTSLNNLAELYKSRGRYSEAEPLNVRSLEIRERQLGVDHPDVATSLNNLASLGRGGKIKYHILNK